MKDYIVIEGSKSEAQRAIILASVYGAKIKNLPKNDDINAAISFAKGMGAKVNNNIIIPSFCPTFEVNSGESATVLRLGIFLMLAKYGKASFKLKPSLEQRPMTTLEKIFKFQNIIYAFQNGQLDCEGYIKPGHYELNNNISSQFISGLIIALSFLQDFSIISFDETPSIKYIDITINILKKFGIVIEQRNHSFLISPSFHHTAKIQIFSDWSSVAPFLVAQAFGKKINMGGIFNFLQPDAIICAILKKIGYRVKRMKLYKISKSLHPIKLNCKDFPDIVPLITLLLTQVKGISVLYNVQNLQYKESDRITTTLNILRSLGAKVYYKNNAIIIFGKPEVWLGNISVDTQNDHRMVILSAIAQLNCKLPICISNKNAVAKSYPNFWKDYEKLY